MKVYRGRGLGDIYYELIRDITNEGVEITTRGQRCLELPEPVTLVYDSPGYCWMQIPERKFNPFFAMAEVPWILSGNGNAEWISYFNKNMLTFLDDGLEEFHGSYGLRMRKWHSGGGYYEDVDQILHVVRKLKEDPFSRQALISLWDPARDNLVKSKDHPCNQSVFYRLRNGVLHQTVVIRSNDIVWGTPHNAIQFTHLQALVAGMLGAKMGTLTYVIQNLHYYLDLYNPTLGNIVNEAMTGDPIEAEKVAGFCTATDEDVQNCFDAVDSMKTGGLIHLDQSGYWTNLIPVLLWAYISTRKFPQMTNAEIENVARVVRKFPTPLPNLIYDFWKDSKNPISSGIAHAIRSGL